MIGESPAMKKIYDIIARVAPAETTVLLLGESGTGKEVAARTLHRNSRRAEKAFVAVNCATLGDNLLESELFGHEKGAFTGAVGLKKGLLETADGGTVFLDEVGRTAADRSGQDAARAAGTRVQPPGKHAAYQGQRAR